ncbi:MAG: NAD(P)H-hydrate epimerase, partial [Burkholderiaceae bacterium]
MATASADSRIYSVARVRDIERTAISALPEGTLMSRAGAATAQLALSMLTSGNPDPVLVLAGPGNNGG